MGRHSPLATRHSSLATRLLPLHAGLSFSAHRACATCQFIHNCNPAAYKWAGILEILPPDAKASPALNYSLRMQIHRKKYGWRTD